MTSKNFFSNSSSESFFFTPNHNDRDKLGSVRIKIERHSHSRFEMYKTVRKGDASLQYTILPQTDLPSHIFPDAPKKVPVSRYFVIVVVLIVVTSLSTAALINQTYFAHTILSLPNKLMQHQFTNGENKINETNMVKSNYNDFKSQTTKPTTKVVINTIMKNDQQFGTYTTPGMIETNEDIKRNEEILESTLTSILKIPITTPNKISPSKLPPVAKTGFSPPNELRSTISPKKSKMPRITLKLRENETVPQMYMKSVIASNEKGNITTSVLAHGLSLEGLIFKTPEGTIRPWNDSTHKRRVYKVFISFYSILVLIGLITLIALWILFYTQRKTAKRQKQNIEECEDKLEGDKSTLLKADTDENE